MSFIKQDPHRLVWQQDDRYLWIEAWGENSLRVRSDRHLPMMRNENWALTEEKVMLSPISHMKKSRQHYKTAKSPPLLICRVRSLSGVMQKNACCRSSGVSAAKLAKMSRPTVSMSAP